MRSGARAHLDHSITLLDDAAVVLDDEHGVAGLRQIAHRAGEARHVGRVQADRRLVEHEERARERCPERRREAGALRLAAGERASLAIEREVREADGVEIGEARRELALHTFALRAARVNPIEAFARLLDRESVPATEVEPTDEVRACGRVQPSPLANDARDVVAVAREEDAHVHLVGAALEPLEPGLDARVLAARPVTFSVDDRRALLFRELLPGDVERDLPLLREANEDLALPFARFPRPRLDAALLERLRLVRDDLVPVDRDHATKALAAGARAERRVVREEPGSRRIEDPRAARTHEPARDRDVRRLRGVRRLERCARLDGRSLHGSKLGPAMAALPGDLDRLLEASNVARCELQAIDDDLDDDVRSPGLARLDLVDVVDVPADDETAIAVAHERLAHLEVALGGADADRVADHRTALTELGDGAQRGVVGGGRRRGLVAVRARRHRLAREQSGKVGLHVRQRRDRGTARLHRRASIDRDRRGDGLEALHGRTLEALEELSCVRAEALDEAPLAFGVERIERERGLARAARTGERDETARLEVQVDALQVVRASSAEADRKHGGLSS